MESFKSLLISLVCVALFGFALISFGFNLQHSNNVNNTILDTGGLSQFNSSISSNLNSFTTSTGNQINAAMSEQGTEQQPTGALTLGSIFHSISTFGGFIKDTGGTLLSLPLKVGLDPVTYGIIVAILLLIAILTFWRLLKVGW